MLEGMKGGLVSSLGLLIVALGLCGLRDSLPLWEGAVVLCWEVAGLAVFIAGLGIAFKDQPAVLETADILPQEYPDSLRLQGLQKVREAVENYKAKRGWPRRPLTQELMEDMAPAAEIPYAERIVRQEMGFDPAAPGIAEDLPQPGAPYPLAARELTQEEKRQLRRDFDKLRQGPAAPVEVIKDQAALEKARAEYEAIVHAPGAVPQPQEAQGRPFFPEIPAAVRTVLPFEVAHWPEFNALCDRLGIPLGLRTTGLTIELPDVESDRTVRITQTYRGVDLKQS